MCLRSSTGLGAKEGRAKKRLLVARVWETFGRLVRQARTAMRQPRQLCGEGIGGGNVALSCACETASRALVEDRLAVLGSALPLATRVLPLFHKIHVEVQYSID